MEHVLLISVNSVEGYVLGDKVESGLGTSSDCGSVMEGVCSTFRKIAFKGVFFLRKGGQ